MDLEVLLQPRRLEIEVDHEHARAAPREDVRHVRHRHRAADAALVRVERDDHLVGACW